MRFGILSLIESIRMAQSVASSSQCRLGGFSATNVPRPWWQCSKPSWRDRKSTRLNSSHLGTSYAVFCWKKNTPRRRRESRHRPCVASADRSHGRWGPFRPGRFAGPDRAGHRRWDGGKGSHGRCGLDVRTCSCGQGMRQADHRAAVTENGPYVTYDRINVAFLAHAVLTTDAVVKAMK